MKVVSLELSKEEAKKESEPLAGPDGGERQKYPWGTSMYLNDEVLAKLGISELPEVGTTLIIQAVAKVTGTSEREYDGGSHRTLDLQFIEMGCEEGEEAPEQEENQTFSQAAGTLYGKKG